MTHPIVVDGTKFTNPVELPSMEEIAAMDKLREDAINSLEISGNSVKCQQCSAYIPIVGRLQRPHGDRISVLQKQIKCAEIYHNSTDYNICKNEREELAELLKEENKRDRLRSIPLYSSKISGYRFVCSKCWDQVYWLHQTQSKQTKKE
jgi:hypothetical protein